MDKEFKPGTVYVTYIAAGAEAIWRALTEPAQMAQYFSGIYAESTWDEGAAVRFLLPDGTVHIEGEVVRSAPGKALSITWRVVTKPGMPAAPECLVTWEIVPLGAVCRLTLTEAHPPGIDPRILVGGQRGWPAILSGLKTLLETGKPLPPFDMAHQREGGMLVQKYLQENAAKSGNPQ